MSREEWIKIIQEANHHDNEIIMDQCREEIKSMKNELLMTVNKYLDKGISKGIGFINCGTSTNPTPVHSPQRASPLLNIFSPRQSDFAATTISMNPEVNEPLEPVGAKMDISLPIYTGSLTDPYIAHDLSNIYSTALTSIFRQAEYIQF